MKVRTTFLAGMLTTALLLSLVVSASASYGNISKTLSYQNIKVTLNGRQLDSTDANGRKVEPFIIDGTTYLPVRAVSDSLGLDVTWNTSTKTVVLSGSASDSSNAKSMLGFYKVLEEGSRDLQSFYSNLSDPAYTSLFTSKTFVTYGDSTYSELVLESLSNTSSALEGRYKNCKAAGLTDDGDWEMMLEYRRLYGLASGILSEFISGANSSFISSVMGAASQNSHDSSILLWDAGIAFWQLCNKK